MIKKQKVLLHVPVHCISQSNKPSFLHVMLFLKSKVQINKKQLWNDAFMSKQVRLPKISLISTNKNQPKKWYAHESKSIIIIVGWHK